MPLCFNFLGGAKFLCSLTGILRRDTLFRVWLIVAGRGSRVQSRGRGSNVAAGENYLEFEVTERQQVIWKKYKGKKNRFYAWYSTVANLQVTDVTVNKVMSQEKTLKKKLADFCVRRKFILFSFYRAQLCVNSALNILIKNVTMSYHCFLLVYELLTNS